MTDIYYNEIIGEHGLIKQCRWLQLFHLDGGVSREQKAIDHDRLRCELAVRDGPVEEASQ
jgi:hypothetical protein